jgi:hypothetical protein
VEIVITDLSKENVVLLPKTIDFYQIEITRMLETERYEEAMALLRFLGKCDSGDPRTNEEWIALLAWLETMKSGDSRVDVMEEKEDKEETEADLFREHLRIRTDQDPEYINQLMQMLQPNIGASKQLLALDQLAYLEEAADSRSNITADLVAWLESTLLSPWVQFKALQTLKVRGFQGKVQITKEGVSLNLDIAQVPLALNQYPANMLNVLNKLKQVAEVKEPTLSYFAEEIWEQFLAYVYGMPIYEHLIDVGSAATAVWAGALHALIGELMTGINNEAEVRKMYGVADETKLQWKLANQSLHSFSDQFPFTLK